MILKLSSLEFQYIFNLLFFFSLIFFLVMSFIFQLLDYIVFFLWQLDVYKTCVLIFVYLNGRGSLVQICKLCSSTCATHLITQIRSPYIYHCGSNGRAKRKKTIFLAFLPWFSSFNGNEESKWFFYQRKIIHA
jgi:hypothetical protein